MEFRLIHALMESPAFKEEMEALLAEEKQKALAVMRMCVHVNDLNAANRMDGHLMALEDWMSVLKGYAERYQVEVGQPT